MSKKTRIVDFTCIKIECCRQVEECVVKNDGKWVRIRHISIKSVEFATEETTTFFCIDNKPKKLQGEKSERGADNLSKNGQDL